ncbi:HigA family addiction module antitoxin [Methylosarcina fibrata]|uniref:HigA family addiction module antitoxin n=1 Tax=Methylosarcina fibrata TaxID=105972 RepID=UPI0004780F52|nr:HigA family addiction module antitoxin [Methylosarcina fibrata]
MRMFNPPHPGEILADLWLEPMGLSITETARHLNVSRKAVSELVNGKTALSAEMAVRLELAFGKSAESWLAAQAAYDVWQLESKRGELGVHNLAA